MNYLDVKGGVPVWNIKIKYKIISFYPPEIHFIWHIFIFVF